MSQVAVMPNLEMQPIVKRRHPVKRCVFPCDANNNNKDACVTPEVQIEDGLAALGLRLLDRLGSGGFGSVYLTSCGGKYYALKQLHAEPKNPRASKESFAAEACALQLNHGNVVRTLSVFNCSSRQCILMEFVSRRTMQTTIDDATEAMPERRSLNYCLDVASALDYVHRRGIAHLDVKPANVLITQDDRCKLGDFGCCQPVGSSDNACPASPTKSNLTGTYAYRAPELLRGAPPSPAADVYSLGICLWQMLAREKPYAKENHHVVIFGVVAYNLRPALPDLHDYSDNYLRLMSSCWHKEPSARPATSQMLLDLNQHIEGI